MAHLALCRLRPVFDLRHQRWLDPYPSVRDPLAVGLGLADKIARYDPLLSQVFLGELGSGVEALRGLVAGRSVRANCFSYFSQPAPIVAFPLNSQPNFIADGNNCSLLLPPSG